MDGIQQSPTDGSPQQEQRQQPDDAATLNLKELKQLVKDRRLHPNATCALNIWAAASNTDDVAALLRQPAALIQQLQEGPLAAGTAHRYLYNLQPMLKLEPVAALLPASELERLRQQLRAAARRFDAVQKAARRSSADADDTCSSCDEGSDGDATKDGGGNPAGCAAGLGRRRRQPAGEAAAAVPVHLRKRRRTSSPPNASTPPQQVGSSSSGSVG